MSTLNSKTRYSLAISNSSLSLSKFPSPWHKKKLGTLWWEMSSGEGTGVEALYDCKPIINNFVTVYLIVIQLKIF